MNPCNARRPSGYYLQMTSPGNNGKQAMSIGGKAAPNNAWQVLDDKRPLLLVYTLVCAATTLEFVGS